MTYSFRLPAIQTWVACAVGATTASLAWVGYDTASSRRGAVPVFDSARVVRTEEHARYRCTALEGLDLVVNNYYVKEDEGTRQARQRRDRELLFMSDAERDEARRGEANRPLFSMASLWGFFALFSNEANSPSSGDRIAGRRVLSDRDDVAAFRIVVGDARGSGGGNTGDGRGVTTATATTGGRPLVASSSWPPGTDKYTSIVLEPSRRGSTADPSVSSSSVVSAEHLRDPLRWLADAATHQSLLRCRGQSALVDMDCDADPTYLGAAYLRVMLNAFLLLPSVTGAHVNTSQPLRVAVLGVAGGSLPAFIAQYFSTSVKVMDLVDIEPSCFRAGVEQLGMQRLIGAPLGTDAADQPRLFSMSAHSSAATLVRAMTCDAGDFLRENQRQTLGAAAVAATAPCSAVAVAGGTLPVFDAPSPLRRVQLDRPYDLLFVDLYLGSELAGEVDSADFLRLCRNSLTPGGVAAFNLPDRSRSFVAACERVFGPTNAYVIPTPHSSNTVVLARGGYERGSTSSSSTAGGPASRFSTLLPHLSHRVLYRRAQQLQETYDLPYDLANHYPVWWRFW